MQTRTPEAPWHRRSSRLLVSRKSTTKTRLSNRWILVKLGLPFFPLPPLPGCLSGVSRSSKAQIFEAKRDAAGGRYNRRHLRASPGNLHGEPSSARTRHSQPLHSILKNLPPSLSQPPLLRQTPQQLARKGKQVNNGRMQGEKEGKAQGSGGRAQDDARYTAESGGSQIGCVLHENTQEKKAAEKQSSTKGVGGRCEGRLDCFPPSPLTSSASACKHDGLRLHTQQPPAAGHERRAI
ncbi:hypothetical protein cyc_05992 [Cyclospora cayetanensis]|uniref:Uncharacterized protein n=1 Tax=Cyclospora cayetanensis TaxID=88456 RepID=A0A1D3DB57_9EIME|nr:hypothetical protein cyc_05992 [Cyclospora cayetanensis]